MRGTFNRTFLQFLLIGGLLLFSCKQSKQQNETTKHREELANKSIAKTDVEVDEVTIEPLRLKFPEFEIDISFLEVDEAEKLNGLLNQDTVLLVAEVGSNIEDQLVKLISSDILYPEVAIRYETSMTISKEGPHCDLTNWKHFYSKWVELDIDNGQYRYPTFTEDQRKKFEYVSLEELKEAVNASCGEEWAELLNHINSVEEYPVGVGISKYYLRIRGTLKSTGKLFQRVIVIESPMGC